MRRGSGTQRGFTLLAVLSAVAVVGAILAGTGEVWTQSRQREKEQELLYIGNQFRRAIGLYYQRSPGGAPRYPERLEDLLEDTRYLTKQRYLRKIYRDPMTGKSEWGLVMAPQGGIMGVHSLSTARTIKQENFRRSDQKLVGASAYTGWLFTYEPDLPNPIPVPPTQAGRPGISGIGAR